MYVSVNIVVNIECFYLILKTQDRHGGQSHAEKISSFVLNSHLDPIDDKQMSQIVDVLCTLGMSASVPTYTYIHPKHKQKHGCANGYISRGFLADFWGEVAEVVSSLLR